MAALDVEALLESTAAEKKATKPDTPRSNGHNDMLKDKDDRRDRERRRSRDRDRSRGRELSRDRDHDRNRDRNRDRDRDRDHRKRRERSPLRSRAGSISSKEGTPARSDAGSYRSRRRSRSRDDRRHSRRHRGDRDRNGDRERDRDGDYYRGRGRGARSRSRSRSRSPNDRRWRRGREHNDRHDYYDDRQRRRDDDRRRKEPTPQLNDDERDKRTVFVQQLAARLRTKELKSFFEQVGVVADAQIVKDRVSLRSKGVGYVEFKDEESVQGALQLTGQKLLGIPIIVQLTEAEKNRQVRNAEGTSNERALTPFHRLYVGNIHFSITESDLQNVFEPFGELEFVQLQKDENGRSRGYGFVQFREASQAREALEKMNGFDLAGRPIRVGLGNDKFTPESTANILQQRYQNQNGQYQGSAFSGAGGRGPLASNFDRAGGRDNDKASGASALDDTDVAGVNFNNYSRDALMRKLARTDEPATSGQAEKVILKPQTEVNPLPVNVNVNMASRCVVLRNMFDPSEEEGDSWVKELEDDVRQEAEDKYGHVVHISLDPNSQGDIYLKFDKVQGGENAIKGLNGRYFGGRMISAAPVVDAVYSSLFSRTKAI